ncbi:MAG: sortase-associated OmpA-like protein PdsO [Pseudohongiella sp.]|nr:sortase-associated OmpA-like protein PdsO [Pseudohongiella sp.]
MIKRTSLVVILSVFAGNALADTNRADYQDAASVEENTGFFSGLVVGGLAGGPPGVIIGGVIGALLGDGWHARGQVGDLQSNLYASQLEVAAMKEETQQLQRNYQLAQQALANRAQIVPANLPIASNPCCDNTVLSLHFRSGSSAIESHYEEQLASLIGIAKQMPRARVEITGYADRNGDTDLNLKLSRERSTAVKQFFSRMGIQNSSIQTVAYGESRPLQAEQNFESDFFDRRVIVRLRDSGKQLLTQTPDGE